MNNLSLYHLPVKELPPDWRERLGADPQAFVTVLIDVESPVSQQSRPDPHEPIPAEYADEPFFGMWRDREDMADVAGYIRRLRGGRA